jgi:glutathione S-transferase
MLHRHRLSGHSHRVQLFLSLLRLPFEMIEVDLPARAHKSEGFLAMNPFGQVPVIEDGDLVLADSSAILLYLASRYDASRRWYPEGPVEQARIQRWLTVAAGQLVNGPAAARLVQVFGARIDHGRAKAIAAALFEILDKELDGRLFVVGDCPTIADVALYSYTARAPEGDVSLEPYENIRFWLGRLEALPGFVPMTSTAAGPAA